MLQPIRQPERMVKGFEGRKVGTSSCFYLPVLEGRGEVQVIQAHGVDDIVTMAEWRLLESAKLISSEI
jgi:hypothetical protein